MDEPERVLRNAPYVVLNKVLGDGHVDVSVIQGINDFALCVLGAELQEHAQRGIVAQSAGYWWPATWLLVSRSITHYLYSSGTATAWQRESRRIRESARAGRWVGFPGTQSCAARPDHRAGF